MSKIPRSKTKSGTANKASRTQTADQTENSGVKEETIDLNNLNLDDESLDLVQAYIELKRAIRTMDCHYKKELTEYNKYTRINQTTIKNLQAEIGDLELRAREKAETKQDRADKKRLLQQQKLDKELTEQSQRLKKQLASAQEERRHLMDKEVKERARLGGKLDTTERLRKTKHKTGALENEVHHLKRRLGVILQANEQLRGSIREVLKQYHIYQELERKVTIQLLVVKDEIAGEVLSAKFHADSQRAATNRLESLLAMCERDQQQYMSDVRDLKLQLKYFEQAKNFAVKKLDDRCEERLNELLVNNKIDEKTFMANEDKTLESYEKALVKIKEITSEDDIELICKNFTSNEMDIVRMTQFINELDGKLMIMEEDILNYQGIMDDHDNEEEQKEVLQSEVIKSFSAECGNLAITLQELTDKSVEYTDRIKSSKADIAEIIKALKIKGKYFEGSQLKRKLNLKKIVDYLEVISNRCTAAVFEAERKKMLLEREGVRSTFGTVMSKTTQRDAGKTFSIEIQAPNMRRNWVDEAEDKTNKMLEEDEMKFFTKTELYQRALEKVDQRECLGDSKASLVSTSPVIKTKKATPKLPTAIQKVF